jgi:hypothetical protein
MDILPRLIETYRYLLNSFWDKASEVSQGAGGGDWLNDWKQANWELIVESGLASGSPVFLLPYAEGADYYGASSRVFRPEALPTHAVCCVKCGDACDLLTGDPVVFPPGGFQFECFVTMRDGWYYEEPPFDCVLILLDDGEIVLPIDAVGFRLAEVQ